MPADAFVRQARREDVPGIAAVQARAWREAYADLFTDGIAEQLVPERFLGAWETELSEPDRIVFVAVSGDEVVGAASVRSDPTEDGEQAAELAGLVVDPAQQRKGHGSRLLSAVTDSLRDRGTVRLRAWSPVADDARLRFLRSAGIEPDGAQRVLVNAEGAEVIEIRLHAVLQD